MGFKQFAGRHGFLDDMYIAQNKTCYLCRNEMPEPGCDEVLQCDSVTIDHVVSRNHGGANKGNFLLVHGRCNSSKGNRKPTPCELTYLAIVNTHLGWDGRHYMGTKRGRAMHCSEVKRAQDIFNRANAIFVLPITREGAIKILMSKKHQSRYRWQQHRKRERSLKWKIQNVFDRVKSSCVKYATTAVETYSRLGLDRDASRSAAAV